MKQNRYTFKDAKGEINFVYRMVHTHHCQNIIRLLLWIEAALGLELLELRVPSHVPLGARAQLTCRWQLAPQDVLYSVKWYKDGHEFFRHVPRDLEPRRQFPLPGVRVEKAGTSGGTLTLGAAELETAGRYRCEVSGERPLFHTVSDHADLLVVVLPSAGPTISGLRSHYAPGDRVRAACTSGRSRPAAVLAWFVNGEPAPAPAARETRHPDGLASNRLELDFVVSEEDFRDGSLIKVKCLATLGSVYWRSNEESVQRLRVPALRHVDMERQEMDSAVPHHGQPSLTNHWRANNLLMLCAYYCITFISM